MKRSDFVTERAVLRAQGTAFRVCGKGFWGSKFGLRVQGLVLSVEVSGFRFHFLSFRIKALGLKDQGLSTR